MIDWDDVRFFLAVARGGSVRAAAERLGVNHATVLRRIAQLEERLGVRMFDKLPSGYRLTAAGEEVLEFADQMEASSHQLETRVFGRLSAWQNWIFQRPNAVGEAGALKVFGTGNKARFDWDRV